MILHTAEWTLVPIYFASLAGASLHSEQTAWWAPTVGEVLVWRAGRCQSILVFHPSHPLTSQCDWAQGSLHTDMFSSPFLLPSTVMNYGTSSAKPKSQANERPHQGCAELHSIWLALLKQPKSNSNLLWISHMAPIRINSCQSLISA